MPHWLSTSNTWLIALYAVVFVALARSVWFRATSPTPMTPIWVSGIAIPLILVSITLFTWGLTRYWNYSPVLLAIMSGTGAWAGHAAIRDTAPIRWGSRSDILGRAAIAIAAACTALLGMVESHNRYGSPATVRQWYAVAIVLLLLAAVLKPAWVRSGFRRP
jgi:hypothetical protein